MMSSRRNTEPLLNDEKFAIARMLSEVLAVILLNFRRTRTKYSRLSHEADLGRLFHLHFQTRKD